MANTQIDLYKNHMCAILDESSAGLEESRGHLLCGVRASGRYPRIVNDDATIAARDLATCHPMIGASRRFLGCVHGLACSVGREMPVVGTFASWHRGSLKR